MAERGNGEVRCAQAARHLHLAWTELLSINHYLTPDQEQWIGEIKTNVGRLQEHCERQQARFAAPDDVEELRREKRITGNWENT
tara:strand:+ start:727 stop:978 length:252 start_codon:yes stop_codon:yes gene_type:complete